MLLLSLLVPVVTGSLSGSEGRDGPDANLRTDGSAQALLERSRARLVEGKRSRIGTGWWYNPAYEQRQKRIAENTGYADKADSEVAVKMNSAASDYRSTSASEHADENKQMSKANQQYGMANDEYNKDVAESSTQREETKVSLDQTEAPLPVEEKRGETVEKDLTKTLEKTEKDFTKRADSAVGRADGDLAKSVGVSDKDMASGEKWAESTEKENEKVLGSAEKGAEKSVEGEEKIKEKQEGYAENKVDQQDEAIVEQAESANVMTSAAASRTDMIDGMLMKLEQHDEKRNGNQDRMVDNMYSTLEMAQENIESDGATRAQSVAQVLADNIRDQAKAGEEEAEGVTDVIVAQGKATEQRVEQAEEAIKGDAEYLTDSERDQRNAERVLEKAMQKGQAAVSKNKDEFKSEEKDLKDGVGQNIVNLQDSIGNKVDNAGAALESTVEKKEAVAKNHAKSEADAISAEADGNVEQMAQNFESGLTPAANKLEKNERDFTKTRTAVDEDLRSTAQNINSLDKLDKSVGVVLTGYGERSVAGLERSVKSSEGYVEDKVMRTGEKLQKTVQKIGEREQKDKAQMMSIDEEVTQVVQGQVDDLEKGAHAEQSRADKFMADKVANVVRQLSADGTMSEQTLSSLQQGLSDVVQDIGNFKAKGMDRVMGVTETLSNEQAELKTTQEERSAKAQQYGTEKANAALAAIEKMLGDTRGNFDQESAAVRVALSACAKASEARRESEAALEKGVTMVLGKEESRLGSQEQAFGMEKGGNKASNTRFGEIMTKLNEAHTQLAGVEALGQKNRDGYSVTMKQELIAKIGKYQEAMLKELEDDGMKKAAAGMDQLGINLEGFRKQATMEQDGEKTIMERSLEAMAGAKTEIMDKVMRLQESEHDTTGGTWATEAQEALALLRADQAVQSEAFSKISGHSVEKDSEFSKDVEESRDSMQAQRNQQMSMLLGNIDHLKTVDRETKEKIMAMLQNSDREVGRKTDGIQSHELRLQEELGLSLDDVDQALRREEDGVDQGERGVQDDFRKNMKGVDDLSLEQQRERTAEQSRQSAVNRAMKTEEQAVGTEVSQMTNGVNRMINKLDPTNELNIITQSVNSISQLMGKAEQEEQLKVSEVDNDVKVINNKIEKLLQEANIEGGQLSKGVMETALRNRDRLSSLKTWVSGEQQDLRSIAGDMASTTNDLTAAQGRRIQVLQKKMDGTRTQLDEVMHLQKYSSGDALDKVFHVLNRAVDVDEGLSTYKDEEMLPPTKSWRGQVEKVFEGLNMAMDMERVERMAAASMQAEEAEGGGMMSAKEKMDHEIAMIKKRMQNEIDWVREKAKNKVAEIEANEALSRREKDAMIAAIMKKADRDVYSLTVKTQKMLSDQYMSAHKLQEEISALEALVSRAEHLAGEGSAESAAWAKAMKEEVKNRLKSLRKKYIDNYSLLQIQSAIAGLDGRISTSLGVTHGKQSAEARAKAAEDAAAQLEAMTKTREKNDHELEQQLAAIRKLEGSLEAKPPTH
jgi:hypothetical protein